MDATSQDPEVLGGELIFAGTRVPMSPGQHGAGRVEHGGKAMDESKPSEQVETVLEDADDLAAVARRRGEPTIAHEEILAALAEADADIAAGRLLSPEEVRRSLNLGGSGANENKA
jgi:hypothetical protein